MMNLQSADARPVVYDRAFQMLKEDRPGMGILYLTDIPMGDPQFAMVATSKWFG